jgi:folate-binding protein YgfZ
VQAAVHDLAVADGGDRAWIEMRGPDAAEFLQRVLASDLRALPANGGQWSAMLDGRGHWIADLLLFRDGAAADEVFGMDLPAERAEAFTTRLEMLRFGERLAWSPALPQPARLLVLGPAAEAACSGFGLHVPDHGGFGIARRGGDIVLRRPDRGAACLECVGGAERITTLRAALRKAGAKESGAAALETLRIAAGVPRYGADFDAESALPVSGEWHRVSVTKGCYAGQEVVARVNTYGEAPRQLCRLAFDGTQPLAGAELADADGKLVGSVSSWALAPVGKRGIGLGTVRRKAAATGCRLVAILGDAREHVTVEVPEKRLG